MKKQLVCACGRCGCALPYSVRRRKRGTECSNSNSGAERRDHDDVFDAKGDVVTRITQESVIDLSGYTDEMIDMLDVPWRQRKRLMLV